MKAAPFNEEEDMNPGRCHGLMYAELFEFIVDLMVSNTNVYHFHHQHTHKPIHLIILTLGFIYEGVVFPPINQLLCGLLFTI